MTALKLFLFDLDGTLVSTGGAGLRALSRAFKDLFGFSDAHKQIDPSGKTDPAIFREILRRFLGRDLTETDLSSISETYLGHLAVEMETANTKPLAGVQEFVARVAQDPGIVIGLGTGNLEKGARLKLAPTGLNKYFEFGGFGSDAEDRADVLRFGHRRAENKTGSKISWSDVYVIGDTLLDIVAAKRAGFRSVAVATGKVSFDTLKTGQPDYLLRDLRDGAQVMEN